MIKSETENIIIKSCDICNKEESIPKVGSVSIIGNIDRALCEEHREEFKEWIKARYLDTLKFGCQCKLLSNFIEELKNG